jgi:perosamine synthetase
VALHGGIEGDDKGSAGVIPYGRQYIDEEDIKAVVDVLRSDWITQGPKIAEFERKVADYCGAKYAVAVSSGTAALHLACMAAGVSTGDEIITSPITFVASANCAIYVGARPIFADIRPDTYCIDVDEIKRKITTRTKAVIPVDFAGHPCDMDEINEIARNKGLVVIEDAAHSLGAEYKKKKVGSLTDMTILSFHPVKHITTGEGGMVVTNNIKYYERLLLLRTHGITRDKDKFVGKENSTMPWYYEMQEMGFNYRITDIQCALGISQMNKLDGFVGRRREIAAAYDEAFRDVEEIVKPTQLAGYKSSYHLYPILLKTLDRDAFFGVLRESKLGVNVHYIPVHRHPYYRSRFNYREGDFPAAEDFYRRCISLPIYPRISDAEVEYVIQTVRNAVRRR